MITEVDDALRTMVRTALGGAEAEVVFDAPTTDWAARRNAPTVNLYLYDLREDLRRRTRGFIETQTPDGVVRSHPPRYFRLSYLVTAWTQRPEDEHRLLEVVLGHLVQHEVLPEHDLFLPPGADPVVQLLVGLPPPEDRGFADVWSALGGELKPSIDVVVVAPLAVRPGPAAGPPVREPLILDAKDVVPDGGADVGRTKHSPPPRTEATGPAGGADRPTSPKARARGRR
ncbi:DUF4255 domain-containing protein [Occultella glacieicola]|uniref:DUF4255 domain-containing protein n=1 Tax=Occultella glacieicola TaxID=2518684 RepID=A0ABY2EC81_9MICO|nr:DUF4255 domain-containing protein [Occultella glacieicola]TDE98772.1 DUF4255 domain-containing protein [Occultella glacieicola]